MIKKVKNLRIRNQPFLIIPIPFTDELLSSWLIRTAYAHHTHPHTFLNLHFGDKYRAIFHKNIDVIISDADIEKISLKTKNKVQVDKLTLKNYQTFLQEKIIDNGLNKFLCNIRFCPECLTEDKVPFFRTYWKISLYTVCLKHQNFMIDYCQECGEKIDISKMYNNKLSFCYCHKCNFDLRKTKKQILDKDLKSYFYLYKKMHNILYKGYVIFDKYFIYSFYFFDTVFQFYKFFLRYGNIENIKEYEIFEYLKIKKLSSSKTIHQQISILEQYSLDCIVMYLFENYPRNLEKYIRENNLNHWQVVKDMGYTSFWFETLINEISPKFIPITKFITDKEIENGKKYLIKNNIEVNKASLSRLLGCNFFSIYNKLNV